MNALARYLRALGPTWSHFTTLPLILWPLYVVLVRRELRWELMALAVVIAVVAFWGPRMRRLYVGLFPLPMVCRKFRPGCSRCWGSSTTPCAS